MYISFKIQDITFFYEKFLLKFMYYVYREEIRECLNIFKNFKCVVYFI